MNLIIVESPTKAKTLRKFLGKDYAIEASMGHVRDLPKSKLGVDVDKNFEPEYEISKGKNIVIQKLKKIAETADKVYLATDPDREGEAISWHIKFLLQQNGRKKTPKIADDKFSRVTFHEITKSAIEAAVNSPGALNLSMVDAQQARRVVDRLVGYNVSPVLWRKVRRGLSAGRVQSVAVRMIVEREREIKAFKPVEFWRIAALLTPLTSESPFEAELYEVAGKKVTVRGQVNDNEKNSTKNDSESTTRLRNQPSTRQIYIDSQSIAEPIIADLQSADYLVESVEKKEQQKRPNPPFTTSTLQQAAANVLGWSGKQTMMIAQQLYEAGLITYHRTDSVNLANEAIVAGREEIQKKYGSDYVPEKPNVYQTKSKNAQEAHEAIRPSRPYLIDITTEMREADVKHQKLYQLIWRRFMACQMKPAIYDQTTVIINASRIDHQASYKLRVAGSVIKFMGWKIAYADTAKTENRKSKTEDDLILPPLAEKDPLKLLNLISEQKFTQPPARYNDASLIKELERRGIGRPSTYATILSTIVDRGYVERNDKRYQPTIIGEAVNDFLVAQFPTFMDYQFTAEMEEDLDRIARGEKQWQAVMKTFWTPFKKLLSVAEKTSGRVEIPVESTGKPCPKCEIGELVIRSGKFGKFLSCSRFPECDYKSTLRQTVEGVVCPQCGGAVVQKRTKTGRTFWGCATYPKCTWATWNNPAKVETEPSTNTN